MKSLLYIVVGLLIISSFTTLVIGNETDENIGTMNVAFLKPTVVEKNNFVEIEMHGTNNHIFYTGRPILPIYTTTMTLPFGVDIEDIEYKATGIDNMALINKIMPAPEPIIKNAIKVSSNKRIIDETIYCSEELYPSDWFSYHVGVGLDENMEHKTILTINAYPVRYNPAMDAIYYVENIELTIKYDESHIDPFPTTSSYDLVIIAPQIFSDDLQRLVDHKNSVGMRTVLKKTEEIYDEYSGVDKPEQIKYFIKDAIENWDAKYILLVGGLKSFIWAKPRDDANQGTEGWHVPVRYTNLYAGSGDDPGYISDLYYADIYKEGGIFDDWDSDGDGVFAEWKGSSKDELDLYPDIYVGRLACRNTIEVQNMIDKIITYEQSPCDPSWFNKIVTISGDGFLDQEDLDIQWDINDLPDGDYTIYAQSTNPDGVSGLIDVINVTIDRTVATSLTFTHDDHLKTNSYPFSPIAEITSPSEGDVLGNTDFRYSPSDEEAYCNDFTGWANVEYRSGIMHIRGKSYDPQPYGVLTDIHVWIENNAKETVFEYTVEDTKMYFEGEWTVGEQPVKERAGAASYMPVEFNKIELWTSNGEFTGQADVIETLNQGCGFAFFSGHGSPRTWGDHYPGVPGNRRNASITGLANLNLGIPFLPMDSLSNTDKLPVVVVGGCHNCQFNVSLLATLLKKPYMWTYGIPTPECWGWWLTRLPNRGAIATIGNTGMGYGNLGEWCNAGGVDNWITTEFFKQYGEGHYILGEAHGQAISNYITHFKTTDDPELMWNIGDEKTVQEWVLLGDPSLKIGGYQ